MLPMSFISKGKKILPRATSAYFGPPIHIFFLIICDIVPVRHPVTCGWAFFVIFVKLPLCGH